MGKRIDLTGQRFSRLVVISLNEEVSKQKKSSHWNCICDCGNETVVWAADLKRGNTQSCGCLAKDVAKERIEDLIGKRFGRLVVVKHNDEISKQKNGVYWNCICDCGNETVVDGASLRGGRTQSCGCLQKEVATQQWENDEFRQKHRNKMEQVWLDEAFKQKRSELSSKWLKQQWENDEFRQMQSAMKSNYKGGITSISTHLKTQNEEWFIRSKQETNYTCQLTGKRGVKLHTHHLYAFSLIVLDAHNTYNIEVKPQVKDYTKDELKLLEEYVAEWHKDSSNAVVLSEEAHKLFHSIYGKGGNTPEQYEEFKQRYINGEFKDLI